MLNTLLTPDVVQLLPACDNWRHAIALSCQPLVDNGSIESTYIEAIYRSHEAIGPYYVVGPGIAMPHARPEDGVNKLSVSLTLIRDGVVFHSDGNDPVHLLIVLAATDSNSHIDIISQLAQLFDTPDDVAALINATEIEQVLSVISRY
ncbi:PTS system mannitol-specific transporter subunit IIA [Pectobacterium betavasculorum]|uniref:PTS system mannitol-specific transporter subunit IIA n=1 Tax=Pectobacterium betavasculorum TaxID=55207 RepID=A0A093S5B0_9GAMM|nr:PTS sugar transporter subunit IIA [Pectobacterium betavasculorum]KFX05306.1 PTS system mannitol-specific transporter subunit IIA [Pectobacterium betavasculorum]